MVDGFQTTQGAVGGITGPSPMNYFLADIWRDPFQQYVERVAVMASVPPVETLGTNKDFHYQVIDPLILDAGIEYPEANVPGSEIPTITVSEFQTEKGVIEGYAYRREIELDGLKDAKVMMRTRDAMTRWMTDFLDKKAWENITGGTLDWSAMTTASTWTDNGEFDDWFIDGRIKGGYCTSGPTVGTDNMINLTQIDGYEWDADEGNPITDWARVCMLLKDQIHAAGSNAPDGQMVKIPWNLNRTKVYLDSTSWGSIWLYLLNNESRNFPIVTVSDSEFRVPNLFNLTFVMADGSFPMGTIDMGGQSTGYGMAIIVDESDLPFTGYQYFPDPWPGWSAAPANEGWGLMSYSDFQPGYQARYEAAMWVPFNITVDNPRKLALYSQFRSAEGL